MNPVNRHRLRPAQIRLVKALGDHFIEDHNDTVIHLSGDRARAVLVDLGYIQIARYTTRKKEVVELWELPLEKQLPN